MSKMYSSARSILAGILTAVIAPILMAEQIHACACCETYGVVNVAPGDQLNVREGADYYARWVGSIQPGNCGIMRTGPEAYDRNGTLWYQITYNGMTGWVNSRYIEWIPSSGRNPPNQHQHNQQSGGGAGRPYWCNESNHNSAELAICDTPSLWSLDTAMRTAYDRARSDSPAHARGIRDSQRGWLQFRNKCDYDVNCLTGRYEQRIGWLETFFSN